MSINMAPLDEIWGNSQETIAPNIPNKYKSQKVQKKILQETNDDNNVMRINNGTYYQCATPETNKAHTFKISDPDVLNYLSKYNRNYQSSLINEILKSYIEKTEGTQKVEFFSSNSDSTGIELNQQTMNYIIIGLLVILFLERYKKN